MSVLRVCVCVCLVFLMCMQYDQKKKNHNQVYVPISKKFDGGEINITKN